MVDFKNLFSRKPKPGAAVRLEVEIGGLRDLERLERSMEKFAKHTERAAKASERLADALERTGLAGVGQDDGD